jgi:hypothetical protein
MIEGVNSAMIVRTFVNVTMDSQYNINIIEIKNFKKLY